MTVLECLKQPENTLFFVQVLVIFTVVLAAVVNLTISADNQQLWTPILIGSLAYIIPNPQIANGVKLPP